MTSWNRSMTARVLFITHLLVACLQAQPPERTLGGQTLVVSEQQLDAGFVYYVWPGEDSQVTLSSDMPLQRVTVSTSRVIGYVLTPFEPHEESTPIIGAAFRLPVASIKTIGNASQQLRSSAVLDAANHPEMGFVVDRVTDVNRTSKEQDPISYDVMLNGQLHVKGQTHALSMPAKITFFPSSMSTMMTRNVGDMITIQASFTLTAEQLGAELPRQLQSRFSKEWPIEIFLNCNTVSPDKPGNPWNDPAAHSKQLRYQTLLRDLANRRAATKYGRQLAREFWDDAEQLATLARNAVTTADVAHRDFVFAMEVAQRAVEVSEQSSAPALAALAAVYFGQGDVAKAVEWQGKAVPLFEQIEARRGKQAKSTLERYQKAMP